MKLTTNNIYNIYKESVSESNVNIWIHIFKYINKKSGRKKESLILHKLWNMEHAIWNKSLKQIWKKRIFPSDDINRKKSLEKKKFIDTLLHFIITYKKSSMFRVCSPPPSPPSSSSSSLPPPTSSCLEHDKSEQLFDNDERKKIYNKKG